MAAETKNPNSGYVETKNPNSGYVKTKNPNSGYVSDFYKRPIMSEDGQV